MAFSIKGFAVLLLLTILASFGSSTPLATTTALALRDCIPVEGEWGCAPFGQTTSALDTKSTSAAILERDDTTLECDSMIAPFSKSGVRIDFVEPFCDRIDDVALRQSSVDENPISNSIQMYLYVGTQSANWIYALEKDLCVNSFMHIINKCTEFTATKGGKWFTDHVMYEIRVLKVGPPFT